MYMTDNEPGGYGVVDKRIDKNIYLEISTLYVFRGSAYFGFSAIF